MEVISLEQVRSFSEDRFTKRILFRNGKSVVFVLHFLPGQQLPVHKHPGTVVSLYVVEGEGTLTVGDDTKQIRQGDACSCSGEEPFSFANTGQEPTVLYVTLFEIPDERYAQNI